MIKKALLIGINYIGSPYQLQGCINDTTKLSQFLQDNQFYSPNDITMMTDQKPKSDPLYPNKKNIWDQLTQLINLSNSTRESVYLFLAYSGHGYYVPDSSGDENDHRDEVLCPVDFQQNGYIIDDDLRSKFINQLNSNVTLVVLIDSCHSGTTLDLKYTYLCNGQQKYQVSGSLTDTKCRVIAISGCTDSQTSADAFNSNTNTYQGAMTWSFLVNYQRNISIEQVVVNMNNWLKNNHYSQRPQLTTGQITEVRLPLDFFLYYKSPTSEQLSVINAIKWVKYGKKKNYTDVTQIIKTYLEYGYDKIKISNQIFTDPYFGVVKDLVIVLINNNIKVYREHQDISINDIKTLLTLPSSKTQLSEFVIYAQYGKNKTWKDVTSIVKKKLTQSSTLTICNQNFGDPCYGIKKEIQITLIDGRCKIFKEGTTISINQILQ